MQLIGTGGASVTIIDATAAQTRARVLECHGNASTTLIQGFTITGGLVQPAAADAKGGGILCDTSDQTTISRNIITGNQALGPAGFASYGGGIYVSGGNNVVNNVISNNTARGGAGAPTIPVGDAHGGGMYAAFHFSVANNTFNGNNATGGSGVFVGGSAYGGAFEGVQSGPYVNDIISNNTTAVGTPGSPTNGGAVCCQVVIPSNHLFFNNTGGNGITGNTAIIGSDPQFVSTSNLHLLASSPAKGFGTATGAPTVDFDLVTRPNPPSIGAYETATTVTHFSVTGPSSATSGVSFSVTVTALDSSNSTVTTYSGTVHFTSSDGLATLPANYTFTGPDAGVHAFSVTLVTSGTQSVTATDTVTSTINGSATVQVPSSFGAPSNFSATATSTTQVSLTWSAVTGANHYEVARNSGAGFITIAMPTSAFYIDTVSANTSYVYKVRAVDAASTLSAYSNPDVATTVIFTEDPIIAGSTVVKALHLADLRTAVNAIHLTAGLGAVTVTDSAVAGVTIKAVHVSELRSALDAARFTLMLPALTYTDLTLTSGATVVKAAHFQQLRDGVK